jgi:hypothetical protein
VEQAGLESGPTLESSESKKLPGSNFMIEYLVQGQSVPSHPDNRVGGVKRGRAIDDQSDGRDSVPADRR